MKEKVKTVGQLIMTAKEGMCWFRVGGCLHSLFMRHVIMKYQHDGSERANRILDMDVRFRAVAARSTSPWTHAEMLEDEKLLCVCRFITSRPLSPM